jgi:hypothetical protein
LKTKGLIFCTVQKSESKSAEVIENTGAALLADPKE